MHLLILKSSGRNDFKVRDIVNIIIRNKSGRHDIIDNAEDAKDNQDKK